jgi:hypothetical protein
MSVRIPPMGQKTKPRRSLAEFAETASQRIANCTICRLPEREEIDAARRKRDEDPGFHGGRQSIILKWLLEECGYGKDVVTYERIDHHFRAGHHRKSA